jgi:hypothetical protein
MPTKRDYSLPPRRSKQLPTTAEESKEIMKVDDYEAVVAINVIIA